MMTAVRNEQLIENALGETRFPIVTSDCRLTTKKLFQSVTQVLTYCKKLKKTLAEPK